MRMGPSLAIALPVFLIGLIAYITFSLIMAFFRATYLDFSGRNAVRGPDVHLGHVLHHRRPVSREQAWRLTPISGFGDGLGAAKFLVLPVLVALVASVGERTRWYRTIFLEEMNKDYVRTARAKGLSEMRVLFTHVLRNAMIPILTGAVVVIPMLFMGSLVTESFFGIPGLGSYTIDAISSQDFAVVRAMVFLGSFLYIIGLLLTDLSYTLVDPRIRLE